MILDYAASAKSNLRYETTFRLAGEMSLLPGRLVNGHNPFVIERYNSDQHLF
jgi:hypothetical protein